MSASWPTSVATDSTLYIAVNELQNNLSGAVNSAVTTLGLNSTTSFPTVGLVLIDNEIIKYTGISGNNLTGCTRAFDGTSAAAHSSGAIVSFAFCAAHHNNLKDEIIAIETSLNLTVSKAIATDSSGRLVAATTTSTELGYLAGVTSAIQTQMDLKAPKASPAFTGTINTALTASRVVTTDGSSNLAVSSVTPTTLAFLDATSSVQTQLNAKASTDLSNVASVSADVALNSHKLTGLSAGSAAGNSVRFEQLKVIQVVSSTTVSATTISNTSAASNVTASITPTSASNKVLLIASFPVRITGTNLGNGGALFVKRGSTDLSGGANFGNVTPQVSGQPFDSGTSCIVFLDTPATTSATTYTLWGSTNTASNTLTFCVGSQMGVMTLIEVAP